MDRTDEMLLRLQGKKLVDETEVVLKAIAAAEDFEVQMAQISAIAGMSPRQAKEWERKVRTLAKDAKAQSRLVAMGDRLLGLSGLRRLVR